jgi:hypothetical protein
MPLMNVRVAVNAEFHICVISPRLTRVLQWGPPILVTVGRILMLVDVACKDKR